MVTVIDLRNTEKTGVYSCDPMEAVIAAYAQLECKDFNTWDYEKRYYPMLRVGRCSVSCGDYAAMLPEDEWTPHADGSIFGMED